MGSERFQAGGYTLDSLIATAASVDFAVLVATPDDTTVSRGEATPSARDNIVHGVRIVRRCPRSDPHLLAVDRRTQVAYRRSHRA